MIALLALPLVEIVLILLTKLDDYADKRYEASMNYEKMKNQ
jgi:hypothetical protein